MNRRHLTMKGMRLIAALALAVMLVPVGAFADAASDGQGTAPEAVQSSADAVAQDATDQSVDQQAIDRIATEDATQDIAATPEDVQVSDEVAEAATTMDEPATESAAIEISAISDTSEDQIITPAADTYTVTFTSNGTTYKTETVYSDATAIEPANPGIPSGYSSFIGWYLKSANGTIASIPFDFSTSITSDTELVAKFSDNWAVLFKDANGKVIQTQEIANGGIASDIGSSMIVAPAGYAFDCWYNGSSAYDFSTPVTSNLTLTPHFEKSHYVWFVTNGSAVSSQGVVSGGYATEPVAPTRAGYDFAHWSISADDSTGAFDFSATPITDDTVLYAIWTPATVNYTVVYWFEKPNITGEPGTEPSNYAYKMSETKTAVAGSTVAPVAADLQGIDYGVFDHSDSEVVAGNGTTVVNVYFKRAIYTITFDLGAGNSMTFLDGSGTYTGSEYSISVKYEQDVSAIWPSEKTVTFTDVAQPTYRFGGWYSPANWANTAFVTHRFTVTSQILGNHTTATTIATEALWEGSESHQANYWFEKLDTDTGSGETTTTFNGKTYVLSDYTQPVSFVGTLYPKDIRGVEFVGGYIPGTYNGYYTGSDGYTYHEGVGDGVAHTDYDLFYDRDVAMISFNTMGGTAIDSVGNIKWETPLANYKPADPTREGYTFKGWYLDADCNTAYDWATATMPLDGVTLFAAWEPSAFTANFYTHEGDDIPVVSQGVAQDGYIIDPGTYVIGHGYGGYGQFLGWYWYLPGTDGALKLGYGWETPVSSDVVLFGEWKTAGFTMKYLAGDGSGTVPTDANEYALDVLAPVASGDSLTPPQDKTFVGWQVAYNGKGTGAVYYPNETIQMDADTTMIAYYVTSSSLAQLDFDANYQGADPQTETWTVAQNSSVVLPDSMFTRTGYTFVGWNTRADGTGTAYAPSNSYLVSGKTQTLYAQWSANPDTIYTVEYYLVGADGATAQLSDRQVFRGATGVPISIDGAGKYDGYVYQPDFNQNGMVTVSSGIIAADGSLILKLYYTPETATPPATTPDDTSPATTPVDTPIVTTTATVAASPTPTSGAEAVSVEQTPLAAGNTKTPVCWVHWLMLLGIMLTIIYGAVVIIRRHNYSDDLRSREDHILGTDGETDQTVPVGTVAKEA